MSSFLQVQLATATQETVHPEKASGPKSHFVFSESKDAVLGNCQGSSWSETRVFPARACKHPSPYRGASETPVPPSEPTVSGVTDFCSYTLLESLEDAHRDWVRAELPPPSCHVNLSSRERWGGGELRCIS